MTNPSDASKPTIAPAEDAEQSLLDALRAGRSEAYDALVRTHGPRMMATARRMLANEEDARDALQDAFLSMFRAIPSFANKCRLSTWLHRIVVNAALMKMRSQRSRPESLIDDLLPRFTEDGHHLEPPCPWTERTTQLLMASDDRDLVRRAIDRLPASHREVVLLRDIEELSTEETASLLNVTTNAVKIRLHRARQGLRTLLDHHFQDAQP